MAQKKYICVSLMLRKEDIKELLFSRDYCVWGTKADLTSFLNDSKKNQQAIIDKSLTVMKKGSEFMLKRNKELLESKDRYLCVSVMITDTDKLARMKYVDKYRIYGTKEDCLAMIKKLKQPTEISIIPQSQPKEFMFSINKHGDAISKSLLSVMPETQLIGKSQVSKEWKDIINQIIEPRVNSLKKDPFRYQKLLYNSSVITMLRLYKLGHLNYRNYISEEYIDPTTIEFITWVMRAALKYDVISEVYLKKYFRLLSFCIFSIEPHDRERVKRLRQLAEPVVRRYLWIVRWGDDIKSERHFREKAKTLKDLDKADKDVKKAYPRINFRETINKIYMTLGPEKWNELPKFGNLKDLEVNPKKIRESDFTLANANIPEIHNMKNIERNNLSVPQATENAIRRVEKHINEFEAESYAINSNDEAASDNWINGKNILLNILIPDIVRITRVIYAIPSVKARKHAFSLVYRVVQGVHRISHTFFNNGSVYLDIVGDYIFGFDFGVLTMITKYCSPDDVKDVDPADLMTLTELFTKAVSNNGYPNFEAERTDDLSTYIYARFNKDEDGKILRPKDLFSTKPGSFVDDDDLVSNPDIIRDFDIHNLWDIFDWDIPESYSVIMELIRKFNGGVEKVTNKKFLYKLCSLGLSQGSSLDNTICYLLVKTIRVMLKGQEEYNIDFLKHSYEWWFDELKVLCRTFEMK
jgi:hypothetical protein